VNRLTKKNTFIAGIILLFACRYDNNVLSLKKENDGQQFDLKLGQVIKIELDSNPSTGFIWTIEEINKTCCIRIAESKYSRSSDKLGAPGKQCYVVKAAQCGREELRFIYHRQWEKNIAPIDSFHLIILVR